MREGKTNTYGKALYCGVQRHKDVLFYAHGALAFYLLHRFAQADSAGFPNLLSWVDFFDLMLFTYSSETKRGSKSAQRRDC